MGPSTTQAVDDVRTRVALAAADVDGGAVCSWSAAALSHRVENLTTAQLERVAGTLDDGTPWSVIAKTIQPASESPAFAQIPDEHHEQVLEDLRWLDEPDVYRSGLSSELPDGLRMPAIHHIEESQPTRLTIWMEDVDDVTPWDLARYRRTAEALGALGGRWTGDDAESLFGLRRRDISRLYFGKVTHLDLPLQASDAFWRDPDVAAVVDSDHRRDLRRVAQALPRLLDRLTLVPTGVCHGDATPDNFREPGDGGIVAIDWSYGHVGALGSDLGQLLVGRFESGAANLDDVEPIARTVFDGYCAGLDRTGAEIEPTQVETAWAVHLAIRSVFSALVLDHRPDLTGVERRELLRRRAGVARFGIDLALRMAE